MIPGSARRWLGAAAVALLALGLLRIGVLVLHEPLAGYANQYDMARTSACLGLWPDTALSQRALATPQAPLQQYRYDADAADEEGCYPSTTVALVAMALALDRVAEAASAAPARDFDLRQAGLLQVLVLLGVALALDRRLRAQSCWRLGHAAFVALALADPFNALYANTLYTEAAALLAAYAAVGLLLHLALPRTGAGAQSSPLAEDSQAAANTNRQHAVRADLRACALLAIALLALGFSRVQHLLLPLALALPAAVLLWPRGRALQGAALSLLLLSCALIVAQLAQQHAHSGIAAANRSNALLGALLPASADPIRTAQRLGLPESCASLEHATWYLRRGRDVQDECPELAQVSSLRMAQVALREPGTLAVLAGRGLAQATAWRLPYLGEVAGGSMQRVAQPSIADALAPLGFVAHAVLWLLPGLWLVGCCAGAVRKRSMAASDLLLLVAMAIAALGWASALLGDGYSELARHLHLAQNALLLAWLLMCARLLQWLRAPARHRAAGAAAALAVLAAVLLALGWQRLPLAEGVLELSAHVSGAVHASGWVLDPSGPRQLTLQFQDRAGHALASTPVAPHPAPDVAALFPLPGAAARFDTLLLVPQQAHRLALWVTGASGQRSEADAVQIAPALQAAATP